MKATKLMMAACMAAMTLVSCNKEDHTPVLSGNLKSVQISLGNLTLKSASDFVEPNTKAQLNNFKIFLTDGNDIIAAGTSGTIVPTYYYDASSGSLPTDVSLHLVPAEVNKVVVVGNVGSADWGNDLSTYAALKAKTVSIDQQNEITNLTLFGESGLTAKSTTENHDGSTFNVYTATVNLAPKVARIEYNGFAVLFNTTTPKYDKIEVKQVAIDNYYSVAALDPAVAATSPVQRVANTDDATIFGFFGDNAGVTSPTWYYDVLPAGDVVLERPASGETATDDMSAARAYHFFPVAGSLPTLYIQLDVYPSGETTALPSYLYTKSFKSAADLSGEGVDFQPGYIYRMNFAATTGAGDGDIPFKEDDLENLDRCVEISVDVIPWTVVTVYPEF